jgi:hypothetical protein
MANLLSTSITGTLSTTGNTGIGTASPSGLLHISGVASYNTGIIASGNTVNGVGLALNNANGHDWYLISTGTNNGGGANNLGFYNDSVGEYLVYFKGDGNVGIGTTSPEAKLDVRAGSGFIRLGSYDDNYHIKIEGGDQLNFRNGASAATAYIQYAGPGNTLLGRNFFVEGNVSGGTSGTVRVTAAGNVGIGTTSPSEKLSVAGNIALVSNNSSISFNTSASAGDPKIQMGSDGDFSFLNTAGSTNLHIENGGNVGIGTTSPSAKIHSEGKTLSRTTDGSWGQSAVANPNDAEVGFVWAAGGTGYPGITSTYTRQWIAGLSPFGTGTDRWSLTNKTLGANTAITVLEAGNVGIGTTNPSGALHVIGSSGRSTKIYYDMLLYNTLYLTDGNYNVQSGIGGTSGHLLFFSNGPGEKMRLNSSGNVGIGTTSPVYKLDVNGGIRATDDIIAFSDARVKENIKTIDGALDKVLNMRGVYYNKIGGHETKVGVIAQEMLEVFPEVVLEDQTGMYSVAYGNITSVLIEAIKEQQAQIEELKSIINGLTK